MKNKYFRFLRSRSSIAAFSLPEMLIASVVAGLMTTATIGGLTEMLTVDQQEGRESRRQQELNRALDFITDEVRSSVQIAPDASFGLGAATIFDKTGKIPVLVLQVPNVSQRIVYYIEDSKTPWNGPNALYRWGPELDIDGNYTNSNNPSEWRYSVLADLIDNSLPSPNSECETDWVANPPVLERQGFYACVSSDGKIAALTLLGQLSSSGTTSEVYQVTGQVSARSQSAL
jgi:type II secretory pathway pseudopilin PulG